jgi:hypothetical protein
MSTLTDTRSVDAIIVEHLSGRLERISEALRDDAIADPRYALDRIRELSQRPLYYGIGDVDVAGLNGCFPVFEECEVYVSADGLSDAEIVERAAAALAETGCDEPSRPRITWRGHVLLLAEHDDTDIMFWFRRVQPDNRAIFMAYVE